MGNSLSLACVTQFHAMQARLSHPTLSLSLSLLWAALAALGCSWLLWAALGCLGCSGLLWAALGCPGLLWAALGRSRLLWAALAAPAELL